MDPSQNLGLTGKVKAVTLKRHTKVADVSSCIAIEDLDVTSEQTPIAQVRAQNQTLCSEAASGPGPPPCPSFRDSLHNLGLDDLDIDSSEVPDHWKSQLLQLIQKYEDIFARSKLDCGMAKDFVHCIHLSDQRPFRLPYRCEGEYHKLRQVLTEMEERSERWASPLMLVRKKNGNLRIWVDYRWLNARTSKMHMLCPISLTVWQLLEARPYSVQLISPPAFITNIATAFTTPMSSIGFLRDYAIAPQAS